MVPDSAAAVGRRRRRAPSAPEALLVLDARRGVALYRQLYAALRDAVLAGRLAPGARVPSTRSIAEEFGISRNTVELAFAQLRAEGYLDERPRVGTFVAPTIPDQLLRVVDVPRAASARSAPARRHAVRLSACGRALSDVVSATSLVSPPYAAQPRPFRTGTPALDVFPRTLWGRLAARRWRQASLPLGYSDPAGYAPLRDAIATYVRAARGARCAPEQILVTCGAQQALDLVARLLLERGDEVWIEDPGYVGARAALAGAGAALVPVPVDDDGLVVEAGIRAAPRARMAYVSPSHQYPLGATMTIGRRLALLEWAKRADAWVLEDDYDSEYRYASRPLACLQGLDGDERVVYVGTFSKTLFPALRLGYLIVPPALVDPFARARSVIDRHPPILDQAVATDFITDGHFARHVRRMRALYAERQEALLAACGDSLGDVLELRRADAGMHLVGWLAPGAHDEVAARAAFEAGVDAQPLSRNAIRRPTRGALLLGYAAFTPASMRAAAARLRAALRPKHARA